MKINRIDHLVLTVNNIQETCAFYSQTLGMEIVTFGEGRRALAFGNQKFNLHQSGQEFEPKAGKPTPGSIDICLVTDKPINEVVNHLASVGVPVVKGPIKRTGATGPIISVYIHDPDQNLIEIANPCEGQVDKGE